MKRIFVLLVAALFLLSGCSMNRDEVRSDVSVFSYQEDFGYYKDNPGTKTAGFANTEPTEIENADQAIAVAKKECTVEYDSVDVAFDEEADIYRVCFYREGWLGGDQSVYVDHNGVTQLIIYGE